MISSYNGHTAVVKALLDKCKNVNYQDNLCKTALSFAALEGHPQTVALLLKKGADVNLADKVCYNSRFKIGYNLLLIPVLNIT
jgi:ankyrin repeat protein